MKIREKLIIGVNLILLAVFLIILLLNKAYMGDLYVQMKKIHLKRVITRINKNEKWEDIEKEFDVKILSMDNFSKFKNEAEKFEDINKKRGMNSPMEGLIKRVARTMSPRSLEQIKRGRTVVNITKNRGMQPEAIVLLFQDNNGEGMMVISPLTKIKEVVEILTYYSYFLLIMCLIASGVVLSIYSYGIVRPLIKIKGVANKMANLDFSEKIDVKTDDEIQELGDSINNLSMQLETNIERLKEDIREKDKANEIQRRFFSTVSHELKTPLAIIQGYASGLKDNVAPEKVDFYCEVINDEVQEMSKLITTLLNKMKYETNVVEKENLNLLQLVNEMTEKYKMDIEEKDANLIINIADATVLEADKEAIKSAMVNMLTNAISFVSNKGKIEMKVEKLEEKQKFIIYNSGKNIPENSIKDIWKPFYRIEASQNRKYGGTGLGLSIVKDIFEKHNFDYGVENRIDGVAFYFIF